MTITTDLAIGLSFEIGATYAYPITYSEGGIGKRRLCWFRLHLRTDIRRGVSFFFEIVLARISLWG